jgi:type I restriction enzyme, S subunit
MKEWQFCSLEEAVRFIDYRGKTPQKTEDGMRLITAKNVKMGYLQAEPMEFVDPKTYAAWMTRGIPQKGDVLFTTEAPLGNVTQLDTDEKVVFAQRIIIMQPNREVLDSTFLKYMLLSDLMQDKIQAKGTGATVKGIKSQLLKKIQISFPKSLLEQKRIVAIVDEAFESIDTAIENTKKNLTNARELLESYLNNIFTKKGDGWKEKTLQEVSVKFSRGKSKHRPRGDEKLYGGDYPLIQTGDVSNSNHRITSYSQTYNDFGLAQSELWPSGTVCIAIVGANVAETSILDFDACFPDSVIGIIVNNDYANNDYVEYLLQSFKAELKEKGKGTARDNINLGTFANQRFPFPDVKIQRSIVCQLEELSFEIRRLEAIYQQKLAALTELKQSILQKAFTGELTADSANQTTKKAKEVIAA